MSSFYVGPDYLLTTSDFNLGTPTVQQKQDIISGAHNINEIWNEQVAYSVAHKDYSRRARSGFGGIYQRVGAFQSCEAFSY